ncbi:hypothetical protein, partial [Rhodopirellula sp. SWK7]|uniref:hypothetical protein n=1 Tax=Rhodopirellula sp. SWK7 TaxID=595460 RepID=UPI0005C5FAF0
GDSATEITEITEITESTEGLGVQLLCALGVLGGLLLTTKYMNGTKVLLRAPLLEFQPSRRETTLSHFWWRNQVVRIKEQRDAAPARTL